MDARTGTILGKAASAWLRKREVGGIAAPADLSKVRLIPHSPKTLAARRARLRAVVPTKGSPAYFTDFCRKRRKA